MDEVEKLIDCPKPCTIYKMQPRTTLYDTDTDSADLDIRFQETTTISTDQYSYTWLNLVAEVGGAGRQQGEDHASARPQDEGKEKAFDHSGCFKAVRPGASFSRFCSLKRIQKTAF